MSEQILKNLKNRLNEELSSYINISPDIKQNKIKEILQFYALNFIYNHPKYNKWIMYGGSALRIIHGLDRMSVDLDFEISDTITEKFLEELKKEVENYFTNTYGAGADFLIIKITADRGLLLKFHVGKELSLGHPSNQVYVKIDLNHFVAPKTVTEHRLINRDQLSFVILTYNMGTLMASKLAAIFLRDQRGVDKNIYDYKGRDIYDLLWYMGKKATPDFDYLNAKLKEKGKEISDIKALFDKLTIDILNYEKMDDCLKDDLSFLFENPYQFDGWIKNWRDNYLRLLDDYKIHNIKILRELVIFEDMLKDIFWFKFVYEVEDGKTVLIKYAMDEDWIIYNEGSLDIKPDENLVKIITFASNGLSSHSAPRDKLNQYATLFLRKTDDYFKKTNNIILGDSITTKIIKTNAGNLNPKEQILLNKSALESSELDDLLK